MAPRLAVSQLLVIRNMINRKSLTTSQMAEFRSYRLVHIDESGCDKWAGFRRTGWSPRGVAPVQVSCFHQGRGYQILPAYCQDSILIW